MSDTEKATPTTNDIRSYYAFNPQARYPQERGEAFERWLAAHDAEVRVATLEEARKAIQVKWDDDSPEMSPDYWVGLDVAAGAVQDLRSSSPGHSIRAEEPGR